MSSGPIRGDSLIADEAYVPSSSSRSAELAQRLHDDGLIYAINRLVLHPLGMALGVGGTLIDRDALKMEVRHLALFATDDPEGIAYEDDGQHERGLAKVRAVAERSTGHRRWAYGRLADRLAERDAFGDEDSAGAECGRFEADLVDINDALEHAGLIGVANAESIIDRIRKLARGGVGP